MRGVRTALAAGLAVIVVALALTLSQSPPVVAGTNGIPANLAVTFIHGAQTGCQSGGRLPEGTTAIRVSLSANIGPKVTVKVLAGQTLITHGERDAGWGVDETVTVPVKRVDRTVFDSRVCVSTGASIEPIQVNGVRLRSAGGETLLLRFEYLRPATRSWLSLIPSVAHRFGTGHAPKGAWVAYLVAAIMLAVAALASRVALRELR
jgi:hypothetical protein